MARGAARLRTEDGKLNYIAERVRAHRIRLNMDQASLCERIAEVSNGRWQPERQEIYRIESGKRTITDLEIRVLADVLQCGLRWLLLGGDDSAERMTPASARDHTEASRRSISSIGRSTRQFQCLVTLVGGLQALVADRPEVTAAGDLAWFPVEGRPDLFAVPDAMVVFGRPPQERSAYRQWQEDGIAPQVVFDILSPVHTAAETVRMYRFYEQYGVQEYYLYDPDSGELSGWQRHDGMLDEILPMQDWISPLLGIRFTVENRDLRLFRPDGSAFKTYAEITASCNTGGNP